MMTAGEFVELAELEEAVAGDVAIAKALRV